MRAAATTVVVVRPALAGLNAFIARFMAACFVSLKWITFPATEDFFLLVIIILFFFLFFRSSSWVMLGGCVREET